MNSNFVAEYLGKVSSKLATGEAGEHAYRTPLEELLQRAGPENQVINDPKRSEFGAPDFIVLKGSVPLAYIETKDLQADLDKELTKEQLARYLGYPKLILTNYIEFRFFRDGESYGEKIVIASRRGKELEFHAEAYEALLRELNAFFELSAQTITSSEKLAQIMGGRGRRLRENVARYTEEGGTKERPLVEQFETFKRLLIPHLKVDEFADMYAQTLVYGLFVARFYDKTSGTFTRHEALELIPRSNPFLRQFFSHIGGVEFDKRLDFIVSDLLAIFSATDVRKLMESRFKQEGLWGNQATSPDPVIHFYEDFLKEYDRGQRTDRGVFYTQPPIVRFIVRSVDKILREEFKLAKGLADTSEVSAKVSAQEHTKAGDLKKVKQDVHRVQILDPAVGTGTFLNEVVHKIYESFQGQEGQWPAYVNEHLLPRLHGFELLMASYVIAHLKLSMVLTETGAEPEGRIGVYLTNSLEPAGKAQPQLEFGLVRSITDESVGAAHIKEELPIMVVIGNPPYNVKSKNPSTIVGPDGKKQKTWIGNLIDAYKEGLGEKKTNLDDDYIKFIRLAEHFIEKSGSGIAAMITNNSFLYGVTHRQMRKHLLETFDDIYILDLHGNSNKKEKAPDGSKDENVFDIQQGVSISLFVRKTGEKEGLGTVHHSEVFGRREDKFEMLNENDIQSVVWKKLDYAGPHYFFVPKDLSSQAQYDEGFSLAELMPIYNSGVSTDRDPLFVDFSREALANRIQRLLSGDFDASFADTYRVKDSSSYKLTQKIRGKNFDEAYIQDIQYRIFDSRYIYYDPSLVSRPAYKVMQHFLGKPNRGLIFKRQAKEEGVYTNFFVTKGLTINGLFAIDPLGREVVAPLYLYAGDGSKTPNLKKEIIARLEEIVGEATPENVFDYIYATIHSRNYREKYKEFLKIDFPRVPYPKDAETFKRLVELGAELCSIHLLESPKVYELTTTYPVAGSGVVGKSVHKDGKVFINEDQYFGDVPEVAWNFYIGGYQPAQKWLKDRRGHTLSSDDISHYQKIVVALSETARIMEEIDKILA